MVPEALALARAAKNPWLEVFVRHWLLQSRVLHRRDVSRDTMTQAVSLLEFASRPETRECPQSVCAVQDLASAYGLIDGFGYANERLAVTEEALSRINPAWSCFDCMSSERGNALLDLRNYQDALDFCDAQLAKRPDSDSGITRIRFRALTALGRHAEAARVAASLDVENLGESARIDKALLEALAAANLGMHDEARASLPAFSELQPMNFVDWLRCARALDVGEPNPNSWRIERPIAEMSRSLSESESHFTLARVQKIAAELAVQRGARWSALRHIDAAAATATRLRDSSWLMAQLARLRNELSRIPEPPKAAALDELKPSLGVDPEQDLALISAAALPSDPELASVEARAWSALGHDREAMRALEGAFRRWPDDAQLATRLLELVAEQGDHEKFAALCNEATGSARASAREMLAQSLASRGENEQARQLCQELLAQNPEQHEVRALFASLLRDAGELDAAIEQLNLLIADHEPGNLDWDRMLVATLAGRWDVVRESARRLELPVEPDETGPIDERWSACRIRIRLADGSDAAYFAWRTGPVTARIDHVVHPTLEQHHGDLIAFEAAPLNHEEIEAARAERSNGDDDVPVPLAEYQAYRTLGLGNYRSSDIHGAALNDEALGVLKARLAELGVVWEQVSEEQDEVEIDGEMAPLTYAFLGLPEGCTNRDAHELLLQLRSELSLRLVWPWLAKASGDPAAPEHERIAATWDD